MRDAGGDVLALAAAYAGGILAHFKPFLSDLDAAVVPAATPKNASSKWRVANSKQLPPAHSLSRITSSCRRSTWPDPCACAHWCGCAGRGPAARGGDAGR